MEDTRNKAFGVKPPIPIPPTFTGEGGVWSDDFVFDMRCIDKNLAGEIWISFLKEHALGRTRNLSIWLYRQDCQPAIAKSRNLT
jgi:hypothetical protein